MELVKIIQRIQGYSQKQPTQWISQSPNHQYTPKHSPIFLTIITCNTCHISSNLPGILEIIQAHPTPKSYISKRPNLKKNTNPLNTLIEYSPCTKSYTTIHMTISHAWEDHLPHIPKIKVDYSPGPWIHKLQRDAHNPSTSLNLPPYLQIIQKIITSLQPITLSYLYMPKHKDHLYLKHLNKYPSNYKENCYQHPS